MNIFVGNISNGTSEKSIHKEFSRYGEVLNVNLIKFRYIKKLNRFGFVEMPIKVEAEKAIKKLNGKIINGKPLATIKAKR